MSDERPDMSAEDAWVLLASSLEPVAPPPGARDRLLEAVAATAPYRAQLPGLAATFDLTPRALHELVGRMVDPGAWSPGVKGIIAFLDFHGGPRLGPAHCGIARMKDGARLPMHRHKAREVNFVLRGGLLDDAGATYLPGQVLDCPAGSAHALTVIGEPEALLAVLLSEIEIEPPP
jgi:quercetin dioxygenase-like cupin family protein